MLYLVTQIDLLMLLFVGEWYEKSLISCLGMYELENFGSFIECMWFKINLMKIDIVMWN